MRRNFLGLLCIVALGLVLSGCKKKEPAAEGPITIPPAAVDLMGSISLPEDVVGVFACASPATLVADVEKVLAATGLVMPGMLSMQLNRVLMEMGLSKTHVVDLNRPAAVLLLNPKEYPDPAVLRISVTGKDDFVAALSPAWKTIEEKEGVVELQSGGVDTYAVFKGGADTEAVPRPKEKLYVRVEGGRAWLGASRAAVLVGSKIDPAAEIKSRNLVFQLQIDRLRKLYGPEIRASLQQTRQTFMQMLEQSNVATPPVVFMYGWMLDKTGSAIEQMRTVQVVLGTADEALILKAGLWCEPGSFFSRLLAAQKRNTPQQLYALLPAQGFLAMGMNIQWDLVKSDLLEFSQQLLGTVFDEGVAPEWKAVIQDMLDSLGDELAAVEDISADGLGLDEIVALRDEAKAKAALAKTLKLVEAAAPKLTVPGIKYQVSLPGKLGEHQGVELTGFDFTFDTSEMAPAEAEMLKRMYGERMRLVFAFSDGKMLMSMGKDPVARIKALLDRARKKEAGIAAAPYFQSAAGGIEKQSGAFMFMSISGMMNNTMGLLNPMLAGAKSGAKMQSGIFLSFDSTPERLAMTLRLPSAHLKETGEAMRALTQMSADSAPVSP